ncbi:MAG: tetratricopeptide repeat protein [Candidatus Aminicenantes bacterium]|nr:tetratricopeptide repeat protein [Candidatus Aminicenantes bacterium]
MLETGTIPSVAGIPVPDALFVGARTLGEAGYPPLSLQKEPPAFFKEACAAGPLKPGLTHYMTAALPFKRIYTHGDCGILSEAQKRLYRDTAAGEHSGPEIEMIPLTAAAGTQPFSGWQEQIVAEPGVSYNTYKPQHLFIASIDKEFDSAALDELLNRCKKNNPEFASFVFNAEHLERGIAKKHGIENISLTWEEYLDSREWKHYYKQRLARLFGELPRWPRDEDFAGREKELARLERISRVYPLVLLSGGVGVGKTALLAALAEKGERNGKPPVWVTVDTPHVTCAEVVLSMGIQLGLVKSPRVLEKENLKEYIPRLEQEIGNILQEQEVQVIFDSLKHLLQRGAETSTKKELREMLARWFRRGPGESLQVDELFGGAGKVSGGPRQSKKKQVLREQTAYPEKKSRLIAVTERSPGDRDSAAAEKLAKILRSTAAKKDRELRLRPLSRKKFEFLFEGWSGLSMGSSPAPEMLKRILAAAGINLRLLRFLALWVKQARDATEIEPQIETLENLPPWEKEEFVLSELFKKMPLDKQAVLKALEWAGRPVPRTVLCSGPGMAETLVELEKEGLIFAAPGKEETYEPVYRYGRGYNIKHAEKIKAGIIFTRQVKELRRRYEYSPGEAHSIGICEIANNLCEWAGDMAWQAWGEAPLLMPSSLVSRAKALVREAKKTGDPRHKQELATRAGSLCRKSIELSKEIGDGYFFLAQALDIRYPNSREEETRGYYEKSIAVKKHESKYVSFAKFLYKRPGDYHEADAQFKNARQMETDKNKGNLISLNAQAEFYLRWERHEKQAGNIVNRIIGNKENKRFNLSLAARLFERMGLRYSADFFYDTYLESSPGDVRVLNSYAEALVKWGEKDRPEKLFEKSLAIDGRNIPTYNAYANALVLWSERDRPEELFEKSLAIDDQNIPTYNSYANALAQWGEKDRAEKLFEKALEIQPENIQVINSYANALTQWNERDRAENLFEKALEIQPENIQVINSYANALVLWGERDRPEKLFEKALEIQPENIQVINSYAIALVQWGEKDRAKKLFEKALEIQPENIQVINSYANALVDWGEKDRAEKLFEKALSLEPANVIVRNSYAKALRQWARETGSQQLLEKAKQLEITETEAAEEKKEITVQLQVPAPGQVVKPAEIPTPPPFSFTGAEKKWLLDYNGEIPTWPGAAGFRQWAAFTMLYSLYYFHSDLTAVADLGFIPALKRENEALYYRVKDLYDLINKAAGKPSPPAAADPQSETASDPAPESAAESLDLSYREQWFTPAQKNLARIAYFDELAVQNPQNPVNIAFLCQSFAAFGWHNIAAEIAKGYIKKLPGQHDLWQVFMTKSKIDLFTPPGKEKLLAFLQQLEQQNASAEEKTAQAGSLPTGAEPLTPAAAARYIDRFSTTYGEMPAHFTFPGFSREEENRALGKLLHMVDTLCRILSRIVQQDTGALKELDEFAAALETPVSLMNRLYSYTAGLEPPIPPAPLYVSGKIVDIKEDTLSVNVEHSGAADRLLEMPAAEFPAEAHIGRRFFAKIDKKEPDRLYDIEALEYREPSFERSFVSLFGREVYDRTAALWQKEGS